VHLCFFLFSSCFAFGIDSSILDTNTKPTAITTIATINLLVILYQYHLLLQLLLLLLV
jgi:hypothetical protein